MRPGVQEISYGNFRNLMRIRYAIEVRTFGGTWRQLNQGKVIMIFDTEPEAIKKLLSFFEPNPLCLRGGE